MDSELSKDFQKLQSENAEMLKEIYTSIHKDKKSQFREILTAVILSLATVGSAWCAYQSTLWDGVQTFKLADVIFAGRELSELNIESIQKKTIDGAIVMKYVEAYQSGQKTESDFFYSIMRPELKKSVDEWVETKPLVNLNAPRSPFEMDAYKNMYKARTDSYSNHYSESMKEAQESNKHSDRYVLLTVLFASILFFGGISGTLRSQKMQIFTVIVSLVILIWTTYLLTGLPVCDK